MSGFSKFELVEPSESLEATYRSYVREFVERRETLIPFVLEYDASHFGNLIRQLRDDAAGVGLPKGFVPASCYWLLEEDKTLIGVAHFRHSLNDALLHEGGHIGYSIRPTRRNRGYGKLMLELLLDA